jgi:hypothetical protein
MITISYRCMSKGAVGVGEPKRETIEASIRSQPDRPTGIDSIETSRNRDTRANRKPATRSFSKNGKAAVRTYHRGHREAPVARSITDYLR